jgi:hypothetical protein
MKETNLLGATKALLGNDSGRVQFFDLMILKMTLTL